MTIIRRNLMVHMAVAGSFAAFSLGAMPVAAGPQMDSMQTVAYMTSRQSMPGETQQQTQIPRPSASQPVLHSDPNAGDSAEVTGQMMIDKMFLRRAGEDALAEARMGQLALKNGGSDAVKRFGQRMIDDQERLNGMFEPLAQGLRMKLPTKLSRKNQAEYAKLQELSGRQFDEEYVRYSVEDHLADDKEFSTEMQVATDPNIQSAVTTGQKIVHRHLLRIEKVAKDQNITVSLPVASSKQPPVQR